MTDTLYKAAFVLITVAVLAFALGYTSYANAAEHPLMRDFTVEEQRYNLVLLIHDGDGELEYHDPVFGAYQVREMTFRRANESQCIASAQAIMRGPIAWKVNSWGCEVVK